MNRLLLAALVMLPLVVNAFWFSENQVYGVNSSIPIPKIRKITSPEMIMSKNTAFALIAYTINKVPDSLDVSYEVQCSRLSRLFTWLPKTKKNWESIDEGSIEFKTDKLGVQRSACVALFDPKVPECSSRKFRLRLKIVNHDGVVKTTVPQFQNSCKKIKGTTASCNFEKTDCGFRNDACGIVQWKIGTEEEQANANVDRLVELLKEEASVRCNYGIDVNALQPSGFTITDEDRKKRGIFVGPDRKPRSLSDYGLYLDAAEISPLVAIAVFNTPTLLYHATNEILQFDYYFYSEGLHQIVVALICMSDKAQTYMRLKKDSDYTVDNFDLSSYTKSGKQCLDLHSYIVSGCTSFRVQFVGGAIGSTLVVDNIYFYESKESFCNVDNK